MSRELVHEIQSPSGTAIRLYRRPDGEKEIYMDGAWGIMYGPGMVKINLYSVISTFGDADHEERELTTRLVMPLPVLFQLRDFLNKNSKEWIEDMKSKGNAAAVPKEAGEE
jgi:hypothetical protein